MKKYSVLLWAVALYIFRCIQEKTYEKITPVTILSTLMIIAGVTGVQLISVKKRGGISDEEK